MSQKRKQLWIVFVAILLAVLVGSIVGKEGAVFGITFYSIFELVAVVFINALTLVVVPLVASSIMSGIARIGNDSAFGRLGVKTFSFYLFTSLVAILIGLFFVNVIAPGSHRGEDLLTGAASVNLLATSAVTPLSFIKQIVPSNIVLAFSQSEMLGVIFFSLLFGFAVSKIEAKSSTLLSGVIQAVFETMLQITHLIMRFLPVGVFCLVAKVFAETGLASLQKVGLFAITVLLGLGTFTFVALPLLLKFVGKVAPWRHFRAMSPALITAFSTSSSSATLPVTMDCVETRAGVSNRICSLVVPLGTSINMSGSALYECAAAIFVAQAYGIDISLGTQFSVVVLSLVMSMGVAGIPSGSLVAILIILKSIGLPAEGLGMFVAVDRLLDMCRTTVNVFSDSCCAVLVAKSEGEQDVLTKDV